MLFDIGRFACDPNNQKADGKTAADYFPSSLLSTKDGHDLCANYSALDYGALVGHFSIPQTYSFYTLPASQSQFDELTQSWIAAAKRHPLSLIAGRAQLTYSFLAGQPGLGWSPSRTVEGNQPLSGEVQVGIGYAIGWPDHPNIVLIAIAFVTAVGGAASLGLLSGMSGLFGIVLAPLAAFAVLRKRRVANRRKHYLLLLFPAAWLFNMAALAPGNDLRYMSPAICAGMLSLVIAVVSSRATPARQDSVEAEPANSLATTEANDYAV